MVKQLVVIHTSATIVDIIKNAANEIIPEVKIFNIVDEYILNELIKLNKITEDTNKKLLNYVLPLDNKVDAILFSCSSISPCVDVVKTSLNTPIIKIDEAMVEEAVNRGNKIGVVATLPITLSPTKSLLVDKSRKMNKKIEIKDALCDDAFNALINGDVEKHNELILNKINTLHNEVDVIVLAQASMSKLMPKIEGKFKKPILASPKLAIKKIRKMFEL
jgi:Asp/Glu/hydantoin racemase